MNRLAMLAPLHMTTSGIASTALDFLVTIDPDDSVWDDDGIEGFVQQFQSLATKKRHEREQSRINRAIETLRAQIESLPDGNSRLIWVHLYLPMCQPSI